jgi:hypothetical protein
MAIMQADAWAKAGYATFLCVSRNLLETYKSMAGARATPSPMRAQQYHLVWLVCERTINEFAHQKHVFQRGIFDKRHSRYINNGQLHPAFPFASKAGDFIGLRVGAALPSVLCSHTVDTELARPRRRLRFWVPGQCIGCTYHGGPDHASYAQFLGNASQKRKAVIVLFDKRMAYTWPSSSVPGVTVLTPDDSFSYRHKAFQQFSRASSGVLVVTPRVMRRAPPIACSDIYILGACGRTLRSRNQIHPIVSKVWGPTNRFPCLTMYVVASKPQELAVYYSLMAEIPINAHDPALMGQPLAVVCAYLQRRHPQARIRTTSVGDYVELSDR